VPRPQPEDRPRLAKGCRLSEAEGQSATLMMPERAMRLNGPGLQIVQRCDGQHTVAEIVRDLLALYRDAEPAQIEREAATFLEQLHEKRAVDFP